MDSRFYKTQHPKYPLYPQDKNFWEVIWSRFVSNKKAIKLKEEMTKTISQILNADCGDVSYFSSASCGICLLLKQLKKEQDIESVYIPSFACPELADAIIGAGLKIKTYDLQNNLTPSISVLNKVGSDKKGIFILTSLFGKTKYSSEFIAELQKINQPIILDEAQAFPNVDIELHAKIKKCAVAISFGKSKPIAGIGGGAIINKGLVNNNFGKDNVILFDDYARQVKHLTWSRLKNVLINAKLIKEQPPKFSSLEQLLKYRKINQIKNINISKLEIIIASKNLKKYLKKYKKRKKLEVKNINLFGDKKIEDYNFFSLNLNNRYEKMKQLGDKGIQCTIYYFPLHLNNIYNVNSPQCKNCENIFKNIVIVPFGINYKPKKLKKILKILTKIGEAS